jgi:hypothetical protein
MRLNNAIFVAALCVFWGQHQTQAQDSSGTSSSESTYYRKGYGFKDSNRFDPKYKERIKNWREQMELGLQRGFLKPADADRFRPALEHLTSLEADLAGKNYPKPDTDAMEQEFNAFNVQFTQAMTATTATPAPSSVPAAIPPATVAPSKAPPLVSPPVPAATAKNAASGVNSAPKKKIQRTPVRSGKPARRPNSRYTLPAAKRLSQHH